MYILKNLVTFIFNEHVKVSLKTFEYVAEYNLFRKSTV